MTSELDLPLLPSAEQIRRREFATVRRGYDPDQVRDYLHQVAEQVQTLEKDLSAAKITAETANASAAEAAWRAGTSREAAATVTTPPAPATPIEESEVYERVAKRFATLIRTADHEASKILDDAKAEASRILTESRSEADRIRVDAQARAEEARQQGSEALEKAKAESDRILSGLSDRRTSLVSQMQDMQSKLLSVARDLESAVQERGKVVEVPSSPTTPTPAMAPMPSSASTASTPSSSPPPAPPTSQASNSATERRAGGDDVVDPRYEDLWAADPSTVDIPDLASIDVDFDEDKRGKSS
jgi:DivIVA domain-containing protein